MLLSYCGGGAASTASHQHIVPSNKIKKDINLFEDAINDDQLVQLNNTTPGNSVKKEANEEEDVDETIRKYTETDATPADAHVTAAIAAAVAAVQESSSSSSSSNITTTTKQTHITKEQTHIHNSSMINSDDDNDGMDDDNDADAMLEHSVRFINEDPVEGPFIVTKIYPYHNHPLEHNMALDKFVLTKIPKILQNDLNFDTTLEDLYKKGNNSMNKFKVSLFVTESGLLDIIKQRYHLSDNDISRKFISLISRRVTTYKARFVLKKKKIGEYQDHTSNIHMIQSISADPKQPSKPSSKPSSKTSPSTSTSSPQQHKNQTFLSVTKRLLASVTGTGDISTASPSSSTAAAEQNRNAKLTEALYSDHAVMDLNNTNHVLNADIQQAAQAAINENISLSKRRMTNDDTDLDSFKRLKSNNNNNSALDDIEMNNDDKLPQDVAEQLRLLSSHFKDVENMGQTSLNNTTFDEDVNVNVNHEDDDHELGPPIVDDAEEVGNGNGNGNEHEHDDDDVVVNTNLVHAHDDANNDHQDDDEQMLDENIQPELRGQ